MVGDTGILYFRTQGGFCNRLRAIVSAAMWAEDLGKKLDIYWPVEQGHMACKLEDILVPESIPAFNKSQVGYISKAHQILSVDDMKMVVKMTDEIRIESYSEFHPECRSGRGITVLRQIRIRPELEAAADSLWREIGAKTNWLGIHFRGTDHRKCLWASPLSLFLEYLDTSADKKLLVTDEMSVKEEFKSRGVVTTNIILGRKTSQEQIAGIIEWLILQKCSRILASHGSSYSEMASLRGGCELITLKR